MAQFVYVMAFTSAHFEECLNVLASLSRSCDPKQPPLNIRVHASLTTEQVDVMKETIRAHNAECRYELTVLPIRDDLFPAEADWGTPAFSKIVQIKLLALLDTLRVAPDDAHVLWLDTDLYFKHDVREALLRAISPDACALFQRTFQHACSGFFLLPGNGTRAAQRSLLSNAHRRLLSHIRSLSSQYKGDEACLNEEINEAKVPIRFLDQRLFPDGNVYFNHNIRDDALVVHNNFICGLQAKIARFKEHGLWLV